MCNIYYLFIFWAVMTCFNFGHSNKLDTFWTPNVDCTPTSDPCTLFQDICEPHGTCVPQGCNYKCVCQGGFEGSDCLHPPSQTKSASNPSPEPSSNGNGKRLDIIVGNGALNFLDSLLKESTTASKVIDKIESTTIVDITTVATSTKVPVQSQSQDSLPQSQPLLAPEPMNQSGPGSKNGGQTTTNPADDLELNTIKPSTPSNNESQRLSNSDTQSAGQTTPSPTLAPQSNSTTQSSKKTESQGSSTTPKTLTSNTGSPDQAGTDTTGTPSETKISADQTLSNTKKQSGNSEPPKEITTQGTLPTTVVPDNQLQSQPTAEIPNKQAFTTAQTIVKETVKLQPPRVVSVVANQPQAPTTADPSTPQELAADDSTIKPNQQQAPKAANVTVQQKPVTVEPKQDSNGSTAPTIQLQEPKSTDATVQHKAEPSPTTLPSEIDIPVPTPPTKPVLSQESTLYLLSSLVSELKTLTESLPRTLGLRPATKPVQSEITTTRPTTPSVQLEPLSSNSGIKQDTDLQDSTTTPISTTSQKIVQDSESKPTTTNLATQDTLTTTVELATTTQSQPTPASSLAGEATTKSNTAITTSTASMDLAGELSTRAGIEKGLDTIQDKPTTTIMTPSPFQLSLSNLPILSAFLSPHFAPLVSLPKQLAVPTTNEIKASETTTPPTLMTSEISTTLAEPVSTTSVPRSTPGSSEGDVLISAAAVKDSKSTQDNNKLDKDETNPIEDPKQNLNTVRPSLAILTSTATPQSSSPTSSDSEPQIAIKESKKSEDPISKSLGIKTWKTGELSEPKITDDNNVVPNNVRGHMTRKGKIFKDLIWDTIFALPSAPEIPRSTTPIAQFQPITVHVPPSLISVQPISIHTTTSSSVRENTIDNQSNTSSAPELQIGHQSITSASPEQLVRIHSTTSSAPEPPVRIHPTTSSAPEQPVRIHSTTPSALEQPVRIRSTTSPALEQPVRIDSTTSSAPEQPVRSHSTTSSAPEQPVRIHSTTQSSQEQQKSGNPNQDDDKKSSNEDQDDANPPSTPDSKTTDLDDLTTVGFDWDSYKPYSK